MTQTFGQREAFRHARESRLLSGSRNCDAPELSRTSGNSLNLPSENAAQTANRSTPIYNDLDSSGRDAQSMRTARGIATAFIAGVCVWAIVLVVGYFLWVYRP